MARGWESKSVEAQRDEGARPEPEGPPVTAEERSDRQRRLGLELARARALSEREATTSPVRRAALDEALAHLDRELAGLRRSS